MSTADAQSNWDKLEVIKKAAIEIRTLQKSQGNSKALAEIDECFGRILEELCQANELRYGPRVELLHHAGALCFDRALTSA